MQRQNARPTRRLLAAAIPAAAWVFLAVASAVLSPPVSSSAFAAEDADDQYAVAAGLYDRQQWKLAAEEFRRFLEANPNHQKAGEALFFLGESLLQSAQADQSAGRAKEARDGFEQADALFREYLRRSGDGSLARQAMFRSAEMAYFLGKSDAAREQLEAFLAKYSNDRLGAYVLPYLGDLALGRDDFAEAERRFRQGLEGFPEGPLQDDCRYGLARALDRQGHVAEAERLYLGLSGKLASPLADDARFHLGALQYAAGRFDEAAETFAALEQDFPASSWNAQARLGRAWALMKLLRRDQAKPLLESLAADPSVGLQARYWLGLIQKADGDAPAAAATLLDAANAAGDDPLAPAMRFHAGDALLLGGQVEAAAREFDAVVVWHDGNHEWLDDALCGKLRAAIKAGDPTAVDRAAAEFDRRAAKSPLRAEVQTLLARSLLERQRPDEAAALLEPLIAPEGFDQRSLERRFLLALAYERTKRQAHALDVLRPVVEKATGTLKADALLRVGSLRVAAGQYAEAVRALESFLATNPSGDSLLKALGELAVCRARLGQLDEAKQLYAQLERQYPNHPLLAALTAQLAEAAYDANDARWAEQLFAQLAQAAAPTTSPSGPPATAGPSVPGATGSAPGESAATPGASTPGATASGPRTPASPTTPATAPPSAQDIPALMGLAWSRFKAGNLAEAAQAFGRVLDADPPPDVMAEAAFAQGRILERLEKPDGALAMYDRVVAEGAGTPQHPEAIYFAARLRDQLQQDREAAALYERLDREYPKFERRDAVLYQWAWARRDLGEAAEADRLFERLRAEFPGSRYAADAVYRLAETAYLAKDYDKSQALLDGLLSGQAEPQTRQYARYLLGQIAIARQQWDEVERQFQEYVREFPSGPQRSVADFWIAESYYRRKQYDVAGERFDQLARATEGRRDAWLGMIPLRRAQVLAQKQRWGEALAIASKIAKDYPNFEQQFEADYVVGRCLAARADFEGARAALGRVLDAPAARRTETEAMARWMIGETYFHQKNYEAAIREFIALEVLCAFPTWQAAALLEAGKCRELLGEREEARKLYTRIVKLYPDTEAAKLARPRLENPPPG